MFTGTLGALSERNHVLLEILCLVLSHVSLRTKHRKETQLHLFQRQTLNILKFESHLNDIVQILATLMQTSLSSANAFHWKCYPIFSTNHLIKLWNYLKYYYRAYGHEMLNLSLDPNKSQPILSITLHR